MKKKLSVGVVVASCAAAPTLLAAFVAGGTAYTKRSDTALLSEPKMLASPVAHVNYAKKLKVESVQGGWVRVSEGRNAGWVFGGNLADEKPDETKGLDGLPIAASQTSASAAARPLNDVVDAYAANHNLGNAKDDFEWMVQQCHDLTDQEVTSYLEEQKKGGYE